MQKNILLLGSGELGKELVIALKRLGQTVIAVDNYANAPAMQVADGFEIIDMLDGDALDAIVAKYKPTLIVPEIEAIRTERFYTYENQQIQVVPSAKAANFTMNRKLIRDLACKELGVKTAMYFYATTFKEFDTAVNKIGMPCVVKPLMSSSGKGQSVLKIEEDKQTVWEYAINNSRGDIKEVIIEEFIAFHTEITLLTVTQNNGAGLWGVEFFLTDKGVYFSELSPRPHDTGMVTLAGTQNLSEFELHARAILGLPIPEIKLEKAGASAVVLANATLEHFTITGVEKALEQKNTDVRIFGKPTTRPYRRMAVALVYDAIGTDMDELRKKVKEMADLIGVV